MTKPIIVGVALDVSFSMEDILPCVCNETLELVQSVNPEKIVFCTFSDDVHCETFHVDELKTKIRSVRPIGMTAMYDGVTTMLHQLMEFAKSGHGVLAVVVTDGFENASVLYTQKDLIKAKDDLRRIAGKDSIREICIGENLKAATVLRNSTPGLEISNSQTALRNSRSISGAFDGIKNSSKV